MVFGKNEGVFCRSGIVWPASFPRALLISGNDGLRLSAIERETKITKNKENNDAGDHPKLCVNLRYGVE